MNLLIKIKFAKIALALLVSLCSTSVLDAQYLPDTTIMIGEVTVSAYRTTGNIHTTPGSISVLSGNDLSVSGGHDFASVINTVPGLTMQSGTLTTNRIVIRGMGSRTPYNTNRIRTYLNDIPVTTSDGVSTPEEIDLQGVGTIEIIKGPSSAIYGSGLGGSINMYTPLSTNNNIQADLQYGSFGTGTGRISGTLKKGKLILWGNLNHTGSGGYRENNEYRKTSLVTTTRFEDSKWSVNSTVLLSGVNAGIPSSVGKTIFLNEPWRAAPNWLAIDGFKEYFKGIAAINVKNYFSPEFSGNGIVFGMLSDNYEKRPFNNLDDKSISGGFRYTLRFSFPRGELLAGTELIYENYEWLLNINNTTLNNNLETRKQSNVFTMLSYNPAGKLNINLAAALNHISFRLRDRFPANGDQAARREFPSIFSPRLGINYAPGNNLAFYASAGHGFSLPSPEETLLPAGDVNPDIKPETGMQYELGTRIKTDDQGVNLEASVYLIELKNLLVTKRFTEDIFTGINAGRTRHAGFELSARAMLFSAGSLPGDLSTTISYTGSANRFIEFTDNDNIYDGNTLPGIPAHSFHIRFTWELLDMMKIEPYARYNGPQYLTDSNTEKYNGYFLAGLKASGSFVFGKGNYVRVFAGIHNITNMHYASMLVVNAVGFGNTEPRHYYPGLPRNWFGGISLSL